MYKVLLADDKEVFRRKVKRLPYWKDASDKFLICFEAQNGREALDYLETQKDSDLVITGEGRLDGQSIMGKAPIGVAGLAKKYHLPVIAFSGCVTEDAVVCNLSGIDAFFPILRTVVSKEEAMDPANAERNMEAAAEQVFRLIRTVKETMI